jgi:hypothetical protein
MHRHRHELDDYEQRISPRETQERGDRAGHGKVHPGGSGPPGAARSGGVPIINVEGAARSTIAPIGGTTARRVGGNSSSLFPKCGEGDISVLGGSAGTDGLLMECFG